MYFRGLPEFSNLMPSMQIGGGCGSALRILVCVALIGVLPFAGVAGFVGLVPTAIPIAESTEDQEDETLERLHRDHVVGEARHRSARYRQHHISAPTYPSRMPNARYSTWVAHDRGINTLPNRLPLRC